MAIDNVPEQPKSEPMGTGADSGHGAKFLAVFLILAALAVGQFYSMSKMSSMRDDLTAQQNQMRSELTSRIQVQVADRLSAMEQQNSQALDAVKTELDGAARRVGSQSGELKRARAMVAKLQDEQQKQSEQVRQELAQKADQQQVGTLSQDVSATKTDLSTTQQNVSTLASDLGMARSQMGTLIARNHDDIEYLRKLGERDYFEFTLAKDHPTRVAGLGLDLKKTNAKRYRYTVAVTADDVQVEKKDRTINEPVVFYVNGSKKPYELVVNSVNSNQVKGYISTPKGITEVAARSEGTH